MKFEFKWPKASEKMFENVDGRQTDAGVIGILLAFGSGELLIRNQT